MEMRSVINIAESMFVKKISECHVSMSSVFVSISRFLLLAFTDFCSYWTVIRTCKLTNPFGFNMLFVIMLYHSNREK